MRSFANDIQWLGPSFKATHQRAQLNLQLLANDRQLNNGLKTDFPVGDYTLGTHSSVPLVT
jgi:hypothetical protein